MAKNFENLFELMQFFKTEKDCIIYLKKALWKDGVYCPHCGGVEVMEYTDVKRNRCKDCKKDFSIRKGTIFEDSNISLRKWFMACYLFNAHKKGISSCQLARDIGVSQPTAWFMLQRLRYASREMFNEQFSGITEIDEVYIGGSEKNRHLKDKLATGEKEKTVVIGMVNRETKRVKAMRVPRAEKDFLLPKININVEERSVIITDTLPAYKDLRKHYDHKTVKHSAGEYVKNDSRIAFKIHTNTIEGFWSLLKRGINGTYHWASKKHMNLYLAEYSLRYNTREIKDNERFANFFAKKTGKISYKQIIS